MHYTRSSRSLSRATVVGLLGILPLGLGQDLTCVEEFSFFAGIPCPDFSTTGNVSLMAISQSNLATGARMFCDQLTAVTVTEFEGPPCGAPKPVAHDHTTLLAIGAAIVDANQELVDTLFNVPGAPFATGQRGDTLTIATEGSTALPPGQYVVVTSIVETPFPLTTTDTFYQYGFVFDGNDESADNFGSTFVCDSFNDTDTWVVATLNPNGWSITVTDARDERFEPISVDARIVVENNVMVAILPAGLFSVPAPEYRVAISCHPLADFANSIGSIFPPLGELQSIPEGDGQLVGCCTFFGECRTVPRENCGETIGTIVASCADADTDNDGTDDACPVPCCLGDGTCAHIPDGDCDFQVNDCIHDDEVGVMVCVVSCCQPNDTCSTVPLSDCAAPGTAVVPRCLNDGNGDGRDDACRPPPLVNCCQVSRACVRVTEAECKRFDGRVVPQCLGDSDENGTDDLCESLVQEGRLLTLDVLLPEGNFGPTPFEFTVTLDPPPSEPVQVEVETFDGTAVAGEDYEATAFSAVSETGEAFINVTITVNGDTDVEEDETFFVVFTLTDGTTALAMGIILNDDPPEGDEQLVSCCGMLGQCQEVRREQCTGLFDNIVESCANEDVNRNGVNDACPVACCLPDGTCVATPDGECVNCCRPDGTCAGVPKAECGGLAGTVVFECLGDDNGDGFDDTCVPPAPLVSCCLPEGACVMALETECDRLAGIVVPECLNDGNGDGFDDACVAPPPLVSCCLPDGACVMALETECDRLAGIIVPQCLGDDDENGTDEACEVQLPGDSDGDGDTDLPDYLSLLACLTGPGVPLLPGCDVFDIDGDGDVDLSDAIAFLGRFTGPW